MTDQYQFTGWPIKLTAVIIKVYECYQLQTKFHPISFSQVSVDTYIKEITVDH
jgi:hypothetical protein